VGKRSDFDRRPQDAYNTIDPRAVTALKPHLNGVRTFAEPCDGMGHLRLGLENAGLRCVYANDILNGEEDDDALRMTLYDIEGVDAIITNPPWTRSVLHKLILHFQSLRPTWLLFDSDWAYNRHAAPYLDTCSDIVAVGRLKWVPDTPHSGKDNASWYRFWRQHHGPTKFHGREL
jgi:hypothetical protein